MAWDWPCDPPAHVFAENALGQDQRNILRVVYRDAYDANIAAIEASALFRAYAKPALTALVLHVLCAKLRTFVQNVDAPHLAEAERSAVGQGIVTLRNQRVCRRGARSPRFYPCANTAVKQAMALFQEGTPAADQRYRALGDRAGSQDPGRRQSRHQRYPRTSRRARRHWSRRFRRKLDSCARPIPADPQTGALRLVALAPTHVRIFFAANDRAGVQLEINGLVILAIPMQSLSTRPPQCPKMARSPLAPPGRTGRAGLRNVGMAELLREATSSDNLCERFREEAIL